MNEYTFNIIVDENFDADCEDFKAFEEDINTKFHAVDKSGKILLIRIPDDFELDYYSEMYLRTVMSCIRSTVEKYSDTTYVIAVQFDIECVEDPDFIQIIDNMIDGEVSVDIIIDDTIALLEDLGIKSKILLQDIEIAK